MPFDEAKQRPLVASPFAVAICAVAAITLVGCSGNSSVGQFLVDPAQFDAYHCKDLATQWDTLNKRELELRANMDRANQTAGGKVVGAVAYSTDYQTVLEQKKMVQQQAAEKKCDLVKTYQSDQTVR
jgi:hypothetical protein